MIVRAKQHSLLHLSAFLLIFLLTVVLCRADDRARERESLRGIKTVVVKVHSFDTSGSSNSQKPV